MTRLAATDLSAGYGPVEVVHSVSIDVPSGEITALLGANGAGKTTLLRALCGQVRSSGSVTLGELNVSGLSPEERARLGLAHVPAGRGTFTELTVTENLAIGGLRLSRDRRRRQADVQFEFFPSLYARRGERAGALSGGEQQMLAIARALMMEPEVLILDEPSLGLAPLTVTDVFARLKRTNAESGLTILLVEQNAQASLGIATFGYVMENGEFSLADTTENLTNNDQVKYAYLGVS